MLREEERGFIGKIAELASFRWVLSFFFFFFFWCWVWGLNLDFLNGSGWFVTEPDSLNPEPVRNASNPAVTVLIGLGAITNRFIDMDLLNYNRLRPLPS